MSEGEIVALPLQDTPIQVASPFPSKEALERAQLEKYRLDHLLRFGEVPFEGVERGDDPPDFVVSRAGSRYGVDCAALALREKRRAEGLVRELLQKAAAHDEASLRHLAGTDITISFASGNELPPHKQDAAAAQNVIEALEHAEVDKERFARAAAELATMPEKLPEGLPEALGWVEKEGFAFQVAPVDNWQPRDVLAARLGFNLGLQYTLLISAREVHTEIERLVHKHDKQGIDQVLLVIGGPIIEGISFPAEYYFGLWLGENPVEALATRYVSQVTAHAWNDGSIFELPVRAS